MIIGLAVEDAACSELAATGVLVAEADAGLASAAAGLRSLGATEMSNTSDSLPSWTSSCLVSLTISPPESLGLREAITEEGVAPLVLSVIADNGGSLSVSCVD